MTIMQANDPALIAAYQSVFRSPHGELVLADLRRMFVDTPLGSGLNNAVTAGIRIGEHDTVRYILDMVEQPTETQPDG